MLSVRIHSPRATEGDIALGISFAFGGFRTWDEREVPDAEIAYAARGAWELTQYSGEQVMKEVAKPLTKRCPVCEEEYPEEDKYCGNDGSLLQQPSADGAPSTSTVGVMTADELAAEPKSALPR